MTRAKGPKFRLRFRRRRDGRTNFAKRLGLVKGNMTRMVVRRSNRNLIVQFVDFDRKGDRTLLTVSGKNLAKDYNWPSKRNVWTAYLTGLLAGKIAQKKGVKECVLDMGMYVSSKGSIIFAAQKGASDAGLKTSVDEEKVPTEKLTNPSDKYKALFENAKKRINGDVNG